MGVGYRESGRVSKSGSHTSLSIGSEKSSGWGCLITDGRVTDKSKDSVFTILIYAAQIEDFKQYWKVL